MMSRFQYSLLISTCAATAGEADHGAVVAHTLRQFTDKFINFTSQIGAYTRPCFWLTSSTF